MAVGIGYAITRILIATAVARCIGMDVNIIRREEETFFGTKREGRTTNEYTEGNGIGILEEE